MSDAVKEVIRQAEGLSASEKREVAMALLAQTQEIGTQMPRRKWMEIRSIAPYPLMGRDAQEWVSQSREASDRDREQQWRPAP